MPIRVRWVLLALSLGLVGFRPGWAELVPRLVRDIDPRSYAGGSEPRSFGSGADGFTVFASGKELWYYDGREDYAWPILSGRTLRSLDGTNYIAADQGPGRTELWYEGSGYTVTYVLPVREAPFRRIGRAWGGSPLLFEADDGNGLGLWATDPSGIFHGVREIARLEPLADGGLIQRPRYGEEIFVARGPRMKDAALWRTDGSAHGTFPYFAPAGGVEKILGSLGRRVVFSVGGVGPEIWSSDGTLAGTRPLAEIVPGRRSARIESAVVSAHRVFFVADEGRNGRELWVSDGNPRGTQRLTRLAPRDPFGAAGLTRAAVGRRLVFFADDGIHGREPWLSDGTPEGTLRLADLCPGACSSRGEMLASIGLESSEEVFFSAWTPGRGLELWATDGSSSRTRLFAETCPGPCDGDPRGVVLAYGSAGVRFTGRVATGERALFSQGFGTARSVRLTPPGTEVNGDDPTAATAFRYQYFAASDPDHGEEVWTTEGTPESTALFLDIERARNGGSKPRGIGRVGDRLLMSAFDPRHGRQIWSSDGSPRGTFRLAAVPLGGRDNEARVARAGDHGILLTGEPDRSSGVIWATDGTNAGTHRLTPPELEVVTYFGVFSAGDRALFLADDGVHGTELWSTDGTPEGTRLAVDLAPGRRSMVVEDAEPGVGFLRGRVLFQRRGDDHRWWLSDGTAAGTMRLAEVSPLLGWSKPKMAEAGGRTFFVGGLEGENRLGVWSTDGTAAGMQRAWLGEPGERVDYFFPTPNRLYFETTNHDPEGGTKSAYWVTEGAPGDARRVSERFDSQGYRDATTLGDTLLYQNEQFQIVAADGTLAGGQVLVLASGEPAYVEVGRAAQLGRWVIFPYYNGDCFAWDGTGSPVVELAGPRCPEFVGRIGDQLYFAGDEQRTGEELWVFEDR